MLRKKLKAALVPLLLVTLSAALPGQERGPLLPTAGSSDSAEILDVPTQAAASAAEPPAAQVAFRQSGQPQDTPSTIQDQVNRQAQQQPQSQQPAQQPPRRSELDRNIGTAGTRLRRSPNVAGDFLGLLNTSNFVTSSPFFTPQSPNITGPQMSGLLAVPDAAGLGGFMTTLPAGTTALGQPLGQDIKLKFDANGKLTNLSELSPGQQQDLLSFLSRQGTSVTGVTGAVNSNQLSQLTATPIQDIQAPRTNLALNSAGNFLPGGFARDQLISLPRTGVQISHYKASEGSNPIPRDRILFNYNFFNSAPGPGGPNDIHRFVPGFEKTFNDGNASIEVRLPFASTFDSYQPISSQGVVTGTTNTELGNLMGTFKQIIATSDNAVLSAGLSLELPTADDGEFENDAFYIRRKSQSVHVSPFVGSLYTPTDQFFVQVWGQVAFDTNGEQVIIADKYRATSADGVLQDSALLFVDMQAGYWMYRNNETVRLSQVSGLAGLLELHFNQTLQDTDYLNRTVGGVPFTFGNSNGNFGVANLTTGIITEFGEQSTLTCAYVIPLTDRDRQFDSELTVLFSYYFDKRGSPFRVPSAMRTR